MAIVEVNKNPSQRQLLVFASMLPIFSGLAGALRWHAGSARTAVAVWSVGLVVSLVALTIPPTRRFVYVGWMYATYPIAWTVSHAALALVYFGVATPIALVFHILGRDPMHRKFDKTAPSYWSTRSSKNDRSRYFRQF